MKKIPYILLSLLLLQNIALADQKPKIGLVLSGGGGRGGAHIGVLETLDEMNIPVDIVVGTSMGAVVGALYASGYSGTEIKNKLTSLNWDHILRNIPNRDDLYFRRKRDDDIFLYKGIMGYHAGSILFPTGIVQGQELYQNFKLLTLSNKPSTDFNHLPIPYAAIASDIVTGEKVILRDGDLASAMLASMSVPGVFAPVKINGQLLIDGGVTSNLPIEVAKNMGADIIIAVDVGTPMSTLEQIKNVQGVVNQLTNIYTNTNVKQSLTHIGKNGILIRPIFINIETAEFDKIEQAYQAGKQAASDVKDKLEPLVNTHRTLVHKHHPLTMLINKITVNNATRLDTKTFYEYLPITPGEHTITEVDHYLNKIYGFDLFESLYYTNDKDNLTITPVEKSWGPTYLQGSFLLRTDFAGASDFTILAGITRTLLNSLNGEFRAYASIGEITGLFTEIYQPLTHDLKWYINPQLQYQRKPFKIYQNNDATSEYLLTTSEAGIAFGRNLGEWGKIEIGGAASLIDNRVLTGNDELLPEANYHDTQSYALFQVDTLDNSYFPHKGIRTKIQYNAHSSSFDQGEVNVGVACSKNKHTLLMSADTGTTFTGDPIINYRFKLGGLFRLSGLAEGQLTGSHYGLVRGLYYYRLAQNRLIPNYPFPLYVGASLEAGNVWEDQKSIFKHSFREAGSLFIGMDTILGPLYFGYGISEGGKRAAYLFIGQAF